MTIKLKDAKSNTHIYAYLLTLKARKTKTRQPLLSLSEDKYKYNIKVAQNAIKYQMVIVLCLRMELHKSQK